MDTDPMMEASSRAWESLFPEAAARARESRERERDEIRAEAFQEVIDLIEGRVQTYGSGLNDQGKHTIIRLNHERRTLSAILQSMKGKAE